MVGAAAAAKCHSNILAAENWFHIVCSVLRRDFAPFTASSRRLAPHFGIALLYVTGERQKLCPMPVKAKKHYGKR